jgi:tetratricopeptide (TPR) repeat protein
MKKNLSDFNKIQTALSSGQFVRAANLSNKLLLKDPNNIQALIILGEALLRNEQFAEALVTCARVVELDNKNLKGINNFGAALLRNNKYTDAIEIYEYGLSIDPNNYDFLVNICNAYQGVGWPEKALKTAMQAIEINPKGFMAYNNLGTALGELMYLSESRQAYLTANNLNSDYLPTIINLAQLEIKFGNHLAGLQHYEKALKHKNITASYVELIKYYMSYSLLYLGEINIGWDYYDYGFTPLLPMGTWRSIRKFSQPRWNGDLQEKKTVLIWREQGLGDEILFSTCLKQLADAGMSVILECDPRLIDIYQRTYPEFKVRPQSVDSFEYPLHDDFELQCPIGSLPRYFRRSLSDFNVDNRRWIPSAAKVENISNRLMPYKNKILVGVCWSSGKLHASRNMHYTNLYDWKPLLLQPNLQFVNLHYGECEDEIIAVERELGIQILRWNDIDLRNDLEAVIALISLLDCVCTVGTAVAMLSGMTGTTTNLLLQKSWVLLGQTECYPWFENIKPFVAEIDEHVGINIKNLSPYIFKSHSTS